MIKKIKTWEEAFIQPRNVSYEAETMLDKVYDLKQCYPTIIDSVPAKERQDKGYFFVDEVTAKNQDKVRFLRDRSVGLEVPAPWEMPDGFDDVPENELFEKLFEARCLEVTVPTTVVPDFKLERLEMLIGDFSVQHKNCLDKLFIVAGSFDINVPDEQVKLDSLLEIDGDLTIKDSDVLMKSLNSVESIYLKAHANARFGSLEQVRQITVRNSVGTFDALREADHIEGFSTLWFGNIVAPKLKSAYSMKLGFNSTTELPELKYVKSYIETFGNQSLECNRLEKAGGLSFRSTGFVHLPELSEVGHVNPNGETWGGVELVKSKSIDLHSLKVIHGELEYCHDASADLDALEKVDRDVNINCGHWISVGTGGMKREEVTDKEKKTFGFWSLREVGGNVEVFKNGVVKAPKLRSAKNVTVGQNASLDAPVMKVKNQNKM